MIPITNEQQFIDTIGSSNQITIIYCGRGTCGACGKFRSVMVEYIVKYQSIVYKLPVIYYELSTANDFIRPRIEQDGFLKNGVPAILIYYNNNLIDEFHGYKTESELHEFCMQTISKMEVLI